MIGRLREWFTPAPPETRGYTDSLLTAQFAAASGTGSVRSSAVYQACLHLIADAVSTAELEGDGADLLQPRLGEIAFGMVDLGQSAHELVVGRSGRIDMLPVEITNVQGQAEEESWSYTVARASPGVHHDGDPRAGGRSKLSASPSPAITLEGNTLPAGGEHHCNTTEETGGSAHLRGRI